MPQPSAGNLPAKLFSMKPYFHLLAGTVLAAVPLHAQASTASAAPQPKPQTSFWGRLFSSPPPPQPAPPAAPAPTQQKTPAKKAPSHKPTSARKETAPIKDAQKALSPEQRDALVRLQIFLDKALFSPGKLDGQPGELTTKALLHYQKAHNLQPTALPDDLPLPKAEETYTTYTIRAEDAKFVGDAPSKPAEQARKRYLPYESFLEFVTERFHVAESLLVKLNPTLKLNTLSVGDTLTVPAVDPFLIEEVRETAALPKKPEFLNRRIRVDRNEHVLELFEGERMLASVPITAGSTTLPTPPGKWRIQGITLLPTFRWDEGVLNRGVRTDQFYNLPSGPNNPVGVVWCSLNKSGIGIHGTNRPETIGRAFSHGCMRVANWDIIRLVNLITPDIPVLIE